MAAHLRDFLDNCAANYPQDIAYVSGGVRRSWQDIGRRTHHFAGAMQALGLRKGDTVGVLAHNCVEVAEHWLACLKGGFVRVGVNWRYSLREVLHVLRDSRAKLLLVDAACVEALSNHLDELRALGCILVGFGRGHQLHLDYEEMISRGDSFERPALKDADLALIGYTSGSTGVPKGVLLTQANVRESSIHLCIGQGYRHDDVRLYCTNPAGTNVFLACMNILTGMQTVIEDYRSETFLDVLEQHCITQVTLVPTMLRRTIEAMRQGRREIRSLRQITYGTMPTPPALIRQAYEILGCDFLQVYGSSEAGGPVTALFDVHHRRALAGEAELLRSAGRPLPHARVSVRDDEGRQLPAGEIGNVWLGGEGVMAGYLNMPEETRECLHDGWLRTGDVGHVDDRGFIFLGDRRKNMIISGGMNIFPASVENAIAEHPAVSEVVVVGVPHPEWGEAVAAMVCLWPGCTATAAELLDHCRAALPRWEVPKHLHIEANLPTGFTDKLDKKAVRAQLITSKALPWDVPLQPHVQ